MKKYLQQKGTLSKTDSYALAFLLGTPIQLLVSPDIKSVLPVDRKETVTQKKNLLQPRYAEEALRAP